MSAIKEKYNIPPEVQSCHTTIISDYVIRDYFIEGHVPIEAISKLLEEKPDIDGIALPGMPTGSLGMGGEKTVQFEILAVKNGETSVFMTY